LLINIYSILKKENRMNVVVTQVEVPGVFLITPDAVMFDPEETNPLVVRDGAAEYSMVVPIDCVTSVSIYHDVEDMKCKRFETLLYFIKTYQVKAWWPRG